ncbi:MAG: hypothetical protein Q4P20_12575 [Eubacteriales bacterium]|nr:hypothetical protein [Eubacteriales bacterium]
MKYLAICFLALFGYRLITNICALVRVIHYEKKYMKYLSSQNTDFSEHTDSVVQLFKAAGVSDLLIPFTKPAGFGMVAHGSTSLFANIGNLRNETVAMMHNCFSKAKGTFRHRIVETFSPLFWINCVIFLPRRILEYLGIKGDSILVKLFQLVYWIVTPFLVAFRDEVYQHVISFFR